MSNDAFIARMRSVRHPITRSKYFHKFFFRNDVMHCLDCKGLTATVIGGIIAKVVKNPAVAGTDPAERLQTVNREMKEFQKTQGNNSKMPRIRLADLKSDGWNMLSGVLVKAANTRQLAPFAEHLARTYLRDDPNIVEFINQLNEVYASLYTAGMFLSNEEKERLRVAVAGMGLAHMLCRQDARVANELSFPVRPKAHYAQHIYHQGLLINPRCVHCYHEESLMGTLARIYKGTCSGPYRSTVQRSVCIKYLVQFVLWHDL